MSPTTCRPTSSPGKRVVIVGAGVSAVQLLDEISRVADTFWMTRREPQWIEEGEFDLPARSAAIAGVEARVRQGLPGQRDLGHRHALDPVGAGGTGARRPGAASDVRLDRGGRRSHARRVVHPADVILWATGFRPAVDHLAPLKLRTPAGGFRVADSRSLDEPRLFLIGYGPSQSTVGANRAGRAAVQQILAERAAPVAA